jgi:hypothetical protein
VESCRSESVPLANALSDDEYSTYITSRRDCAK